MPTEVPFPLFADLDREWARLGRTPEARRALCRWRSRRPIVGDFRSMDDVLRARRTAAGGDVLERLVVHASDDDMAARAMLQALLPGLVVLATRYGDGDPDVPAHLVATAWERIRTYPRTRNSNVAANLLLDARKALLAERAPLHGAPPISELAPSAEDEAIAGLLLHEIAVAERDGKIPRGGLDVIVRTRLEGERVFDLADRRGISRHGLVQRRRRAEIGLRGVLSVA